MNVTLSEPLLLEQKGTTDQAAQSLIQWGCADLQRWGLHSLLREPVPCLAPGNNKHILAGHAGCAALSQG